MKFKEKLSDFITFIIIISPLICFYKGYISTLTILDVIIIPCILLMLITKNKVKINLPLFFITILIILNSFLVYLTNNNYSIFSAIKLCCYFLFVALALDDYFNFNKGLKIYKIVSLLSSIFLIIQTISFKVFKIFIPGTIPFLTPVVDYLVEYNNNMTNGGLNDAYNRPRSFFSEPSHFAIYVALYLAIELLSKEKPNYKVCLIISISLLISGSGTGILLFAIIVMLYIFKCIIYKKIKLTKNLALFILLAIIGIIPLIAAYTNTESFQIFYRRTFVEKDSSNGRFKNYLDIFTEEKNVYSMIIGEGIDNDGEYMSTIPKIYKSFGIFGFIIFVTLFSLTTISLTKEGKLIIIVFLALCFSTEIVFGARIIIYLSIIMKYRKNKEELICQN